MRALEEESALTPDATQWRDLAVERARLLESAWKAPARAARILEEVRQAAPDAEVLGDLERLYRITGRSRDRVDVIEELVCALPDASTQCVTLHREAAALCELGI